MKTGRELRDIFLCSVALIVAGALLLVGAVLLLIAFVYILAAAVVDVALKVLVLLILFPLCIAGMLGKKMGDKRFSDGPKYGDYVPDEVFTGEMAKSGRCCMRDDDFDGVCDLHPAETFAKVAD